MKNLKDFLISESKNRTDKVTLREFITWYNGDKFDKITPEFLEDDLGWDYLPDYVDLTLEQIAKLFNDNLDKKFEFSQEDMGNCVNIEWTIGDVDFGVDSVNFYGEYNY